MIQSLCKIQREAYTERKGERERIEEERIKHTLHSPIRQGSRAQRPEPTDMAGSSIAPAGIQVSSAGHLPTCPTATPLIRHYKPHLFKKYNIWKLGVFSVICLNGLQFWSAKFENFQQNVSLFLFSVSVAKLPKVTVTCQNPDTYI